MSKSNKNRERRERVEQMRREAKAAERRRSSTSSPRAVVVALIIVGAAGYKIYQDNQDKNELAATDLSTSAQPPRPRAAAASRRTTRPAQGEHTTDPGHLQRQPTSVRRAQPDAGRSPASTSHHRRPAAGRGPRPQPRARLDHRLVRRVDRRRRRADEAARGDRQEVRRRRPATRSPTSSSRRGPRTTATPIPDGKHIAFTHWSIHQPTFDAEVFQARATSRRSA